MCVSSVLNNSQLSPNIQTVNWTLKKNYCSIHYICSRMNVTCILPKLILPDNARVAVYRECTIWEKNYSQMFRFSSWAQTFISVLDLKSHLYVYCVAMKGEKKVVFIYLFFQSNISCFMRHIIMFFKHIQCYLPILLTQTKCWLVLFKMRGNICQYSLKGDFVNIKYMCLKKRSLYDWKGALEVVLIKNNNNVNKHWNVWVGKIRSNNRTFDLLLSPSP